MVRDRFIAEPLQVRDALMRFARTAVLARLGAGQRDIVLLVLAEVLNNVAEHAYGKAVGPVAVRLMARDGAVLARVTDRGGLAPAFDGATVQDPQGMPEGGFGLGLIRALASDIRQRRRLGCNVMTFRIDGDNPPIGA